MLTPRVRIAVLCSRRCPGLENLLEGHRRREWDLVGCVVSGDELPERRELEAARVPVRWHSIRSFYAGRPISDLAWRLEYDRGMVERLDAWRPELVLLSSYLYRLTEPMLEAFPGRIVNVHGSDLARAGRDGRPLYPGLTAVRDAIRAGEPETRATAHVVTERLDEGPILLRSRSFPVAPLAADLRRRGLDHAVNAYAYAHQEWMLATAWGPLLTDAIALMTGRIERGRVRAGIGPAHRRATVAAAGAPR